MIEGAARLLPLKADCGARAPGTAFGIEGIHLSLLVRKRGYLMSNYTLYRDDIETIPPDEAATQAKIIESMSAGLTRTHDNATRPPIDLRARSIVPA